LAEYLDFFRKIKCCLWRVNCLTWFCNVHHSLNSNTTP